MKIFATLLLCCTAIAATSVSAEHYGAPIQAQNPVSLQAAIKQLERSTTADVLVESEVNQVCVVKGCWMALTSRTDDVRVTFKDYGFFVPSSLIGKTVIVAGTLEKVVMSLDETRHYVKDAGGDPASVTAPRVEYRIVATGIAVKS